MSTSTTPEPNDPFAFAREDERGTTRVEGFSDGVYATAATLLIFSVTIPEVDEPSASALIGALLEQWPIYAGLILSFILIASTWGNHHRMFRFIHRTDDGLLTLNALMLLTVVIIPFVTTLLASTINVPEQAQVSAIIYGGVWFIGGILYNLTWRHAIRAGLLDPEMPPEAIRITTRRYLLGPVLYGAGFLAAFFSLWLAMAIFILPALLFLLPENITARMVR